MQAFNTKSLEDDMLLWIVSFNTVIKIIELHSSQSLAVFK